MSLIPFLPCVYRNYDAPLKLGGLCNLCRDSPKRVAHRIRFIFLFFIFYSLNDSQPQPQSPLLFRKGGKPRNGELLSLFRSAPEDKLNTETKCITVNPNAHQRCTPLKCDTRKPRYHVVHGFIYALVVKSISPGKFPASIAFSHVHESVIDELLANRILTMNKR